MSGKADLKEAARILLLEDEEDLGRLYVKSLEKEGYQVLWLRSTRSAAKAAKGFSADLIVLDHAIRGEERSGMDLVPELRRISPAAPIAILSNYDQFQLEEKEEGERRLSYWLKIDTPPPVLVRRAQLLLSR